MTGKNKCKILKDIRREIAKQNDIDLVIEECKYKGECSGTCPKCEAEVRYLERELEKRRAVGKAVAVAGLAITLAVASTGCDPLDKPHTAGAIVPEYSFDPEGLPERYAESSPSLLKLIEQNTDQKLTYLSDYTRDMIRTAWSGRLIYQDDFTDKFKLPLYQKEYYVTITYDRGGSVEKIDIEEVSDTVTSDFPKKTTDAGDITQEKQGAV